MTPKIRPYVVRVEHAPDCPRTRETTIDGRPVKRKGGGRAPCSPACQRIMDGFEYDIGPCMLADGTRVPGERRRFPESCNTDAKRRRWAADRARELLAKGEKARRSAKVPTLSAFWTRYVSEHLEALGRRPSTIAAMKSCFKTWIQPTIGEKRLDEIGEADAARIRLAIIGQGETVGREKTCANVIGVLSSVLNVAARWKVIAAAPRFERVHVPVPDFRYYPEGEFQKLAAAAARISPLCEVVVRLGGDAGLRLGEARGLLWQDVLQSRRELRVQRSDWEGQVGTPKGKKAKSVPMTAALARALKRLPRDGERVLSKGGHPLRDEDVSALVRAAQAASGTSLYLGHGDEQSAVVDLSGNFHPLRHSYASRLLAAGVPLMTVKECMRHATIEMTLRYAHLAPTAKGDAAAALDRLAPAAAAQGDARETAAGA